MNITPKTFRLLKYRTKIATFLVDVLCIIPCVHHHTIVVRYAYLTVVCSRDDERKDGMKAGPVHPPIVTLQHVLHNGVRSPKEIGVHPRNHVVVLLLIQKIYGGFGRDGEGVIGGDPGKRIYVEENIINFQEAQQPQIRSKTQFGHCQVVATSGTTAKVKAIEMRPSRQRYSGLIANRMTGSLTIAEGAPRTVFFLRPVVSHTRTV